MGIQRAKGTQDILPGSIEKWQYFEEIIRSVCREYGYEEIRTPIFEATEYFKEALAIRLILLIKRCILF